MYTNDVVGAIAAPVDSESKKLSGVPPGFDSDICIEQ